MDARVSFRAVLAALWVAVCVTSMAWGYQPTKEEDVRRLQAARSRLEAALRALEKARADVARHEAALPGAFQAYRSAQRDQSTAKTYESEVIHRLRSEIENDPRRAETRSALTDAENAARARRDLLMPAIVASKEYKALLANVTAGEARIAEVRATPPLDRYALYKASHRLLFVRDEFNRYVDNQLSQDTEYSTLDRGLRKAQGAFNELESEISTKISADPERRAASIKAGRALAERISKRLAFDDIWNALNEAKSRVRRAERAVAREQADVQYYEREHRSWNSGGRKVRRR